MSIKNLSHRETEILNGIIKVLKKYIDPERIILFGSRAKPKFSKNSDFDFVVDEEKVDTRKERKIKEEIEKISGLYKVDIIFLKSVEEEFKNIVLKTGKIIYERYS